MEFSDTNADIYYKQLTNKCRACESQVNLYALFENSDNLLMKFTLCTSLEVTFFIFKSLLNILLLLFFR